MKIKRFFLLECVANRPPEEDELYLTEKGRLVRKRKLNETKRMLRRGIQDRPIFKEVDWLEEGELINKK